MVVMHCIDCGQGPFVAHSLDEMMQLMMPHYAQEHQAMMNGESAESREDWMVRFTSAFEQASLKQP